MPRKKKVKTPAPPNVVPIFRSLTGPAKTDAGIGVWGRISPCYGERGEYALDKKINQVLMDVWPEELRAWREPSAWAGGGATFYWTPWEGVAVQDLLRLCIRNFRHTLQPSEHYVPEQARMTQLIRQYLARSQDEVLAELVLAELGE